MDEAGKYRTGHGGIGCPFCQMPPAEHEQRDGYLHRVYLCPNAPTGWRGVFVDEPVGVGEGRADAR
jgi:hypothetical protein